MRILALETSGRLVVCELKRDQSGSTVHLQAITYAALASRFDQDTLVEAYLAFVQVAGESSTLLFESDVTRDSQVRGRVEHATAEATRRIAEVLTAVTGRDRTDADVLAAALVATAQGAATYWLRHGQGQGVDRVVELVSDLQWRGLAGLVRPDYPYGDADDHTAT